jgi:hypothetical protein
MPAPSSTGCYAPDRRRERERPGLRQEDRLPNALDPRRGALRSVGGGHDRETPRHHRERALRSPDWRRRRSRCRGDERPSAEPMARNIDIKARIESVEVIAAKVAELADQGPIDIVQDDTFFVCERGRTKLRITTPCVKPCPEGMGERRGDPHSDGLSGHFAGTARRGRLRRSPRPAGETGGPVTEGSEVTRRPGLRSRLPAAPGSGQACAGS